MYIYIYTCNSYHCYCYSLISLYVILYYSDSSTSCLLVFHNFRVLTLLLCRTFCLCIPLHTRLVPPFYLLYYIEQDRCSGATAHLYYSISSHI